METFQQLIPYIQSTWSVASVKYHGLGAGIISNALDVVRVNYLNTKQRKNMSLRTPEQLFYGQVVKYLGEHSDIIRIESTTGSGIPDVNIAHGDRDFWLELKVAHNGDVLLRKEQFAWGMRRTNATFVRNILVMAVFPGDPVKVHIWRYPYFQVTAVGTSCKYVKILSMPEKIVNLHDLSINYLVY